MSRNVHSTWGRRCVLLTVASVLLVIVLSPTAARAATQNVDLDGQSANGAESKCELNVLSSYPVQIENVVTNKALNNAFNFSWPSAGPGGFTSSATAGTSTGVGSKWTWSTGSTVYSYTGTSCSTDACFALTTGPDVITGTCSRACLEDGVALTVNKGAIAGDVSLTWSGGTGSYTVYRGSIASLVDDPANTVTTTALTQYTDTPPAGGIFFYRVRGATCNTPKTCQRDSDCNPVTEGNCWSRGPFSVPGRSLTPSGVTVSAASLTSSLITFFSPPKEVFRATSTAQPGAFQETLTNSSTEPITVVTEAYPPGCCPANPDVPHQLRCGDTCVDYLHDPLNCGACGNVCGEGTCCSNGNCTSLCAAGQVFSDGQCVDLQNDNNNCGSLGNVCGAGTCCSGGVCASECPAGQIYCNGKCVDLQNDNGNCGSCPNSCGAGTCCFGGACASVCPAGQTWCNGQCVDFRSDSNNCGACGTICGLGTCCLDGVCASDCATGQNWCPNEQCADFNNDSANCGACGSACGAGTCCLGGACASFCASGRTLCPDGQCADFNNDSANCGACGTACSADSCCLGGTCVSVCAAGQTWSNGRCVDLQNDSNNCGSVGNVCGAGTCCSGGTCASTCPAGRTFCNGLCYDLQNDPNNCGACGNVCAGESVCSGGLCSPCSGQGGAKWECDNRCVNQNTDPYNCGGCGISCNLSCPSGFKGVCSNGQSCRCVEGTPAPQPPSNIPPPIDPVCPNPNPSSGPVPGVCPNPAPSTPVPGVCPNPASTTPVPAACPNPAPTTPLPGACPNPAPSFPIDPVCPNTNLSSPVPGVCPSPGPPAPPVTEAPNCTIEPSTTTIPPGGSSTTCRTGPVLFKEVVSTASVCGDSLPGPDGTCRDGVSHVSTGTFNRLVPDTSRTVGDAFITPYAVHVTSDASGDGLLQPGETASLVIDVLNAGPVAITTASATLSAAVVDLSLDGVDNPLGINILSGSSNYGTIAGTQPSTDCSPVALQPASNASLFQLTVPPAHPGDTSHPVTLHFNGSVNGNAFSMDMPLVIGIAHTCDFNAAQRDYDGVDGLLSPMAKLVPVGDTVPFPSKSFNAGSTIPMKTRVLCGGVNLKGADVDAPQVIALSEATRGPINMDAVGLNFDAGSGDPFFRWNDSTKQWIYNMDTTRIGTGTFTITIRIGNRKNYVTGFEIK